MIATTSVPAVWALSALGISSIVVAGYLLMAFLGIVAVTALLIFFGRVVISFLKPRWYD